MSDPQFMTMTRAAGLFLVLSAAATFPGLMMFWRRQGHRGGAPRSQAHYVWERSFILSGVILRAIGFVLLAGLLVQSDGWILALVGAAAFLFGGVLVVAAEAGALTVGYEKVYPLIVVYVVVAFLAQAALGGAWLQAGLLAPWIGWATIVWSLAWLAVLAIFSRRDMYFPVLHDVMPLVMGIALLW